MPKALTGVRQRKKKYPLSLWLLQENRHTAQRPALEKNTSPVSAVTLLSLLEFPLNSLSFWSSCAAFFSAQSPSEVNSKSCQDAEPGPCPLMVPEQNCSQQD